MIKKILALLPGRRSAKLISNGGDLGVLGGEKTEKPINNFQIIKQTESAALVRDDKGNEVWIKK